MKGENEAGFSFTSKAFFHRNFKRGSIQKWAVGGERRDWFKF